MTTETYTRAAAAEILGCSESLVRQNLAAIIEIRGSEGLFIGKRLSSLAIEQLREYRELGRNGYRHAYQLPIPAPSPEPTPEPIAETTTLSPADVIALARGSITVAAHPVASIAPLGTPVDALPIALDPLANITAIARSALHQQLQQQQSLLGRLDEADAAMDENLNQLISTIAAARETNQAVSARSRQVETRAILQSELGKLAGAGLLA